MEQFHFNETKNEELNAASIAATDHSVIIHFNECKGGLDAVHELGDLLEKALEKNLAGRYDGHELAMDDSDGFLYMYGPNAEKLFTCIKPILEQTPFMKGAVALLRFGSFEHNASEIEVEIEVR